MQKLWLQHNAKMEEKEMNDKLCDYCGKPNGKLKKIDGLYVCRECEGP